MQQKIYFLNYCLSAHAFQWKQLSNRNLSVVFNDDGLPVTIKGENNVIVKLAGPGNKYYAAKIILSDLPEPKKNQKVYQSNLVPPITGIYRHELELVAPTSLNKIYSIELMPWLEGEELTAFLAFNKVRQNKPFVESRKAANKTKIPVVKELFVTGNYKKEFIYTGLATAFIFIAFFAAKEFYISNTIATQSATINKKPTTLKLLPAATVVQQTTTITKINPALDTAAIVTNKPIKMIVEKLPADNNVSMPPLQTVAVNIPKKEVVKSVNTRADEALQANAVETKFTVKKYKQSKNLFRKIEI